MIDLRRMRVAVLLFFCVFTIFPVTAQIFLSGKILDKSTREPLPYATVGVQGTDRGTITNEDGRFQIQLVPMEILEIRYTGYKPKTIRFDAPVEGLREIEMERLVEELSTFNVAAADERVFNWIGEARKDLSKSGFHQSKAFLELFTTKDSIPTEVLETYYNTEWRKSRIHNLIYKSGRVGVAPVEDSYFMSRSTSEALQMQSLLRPELFPESVLSMKTKDIKEVYELTWTELSSGKTLIFFNTKSGNHFSGDLVLGPEKHLEEVTLRIENPEITPFIPLFETDSLRPLSMDIKWLFTRVDDDAVPYLIDFDYSILSVIPLGAGMEGPPFLSRRIDADGVLYLYDFEDPFTPPFYDYEVELNDYQKLLNTPFHDALWNRPRPFVSSDRYERNRKFLQENGTLKNYVDTTSYDFFRGFDNLYDHTNAFWSDTTRVRLNLIHHKSAPLEGRYTVPKRQRYRLDIEMYFDIVETDTSILHYSKCVFDIYNSYFYVEADSLTDLFMNLSFDLCEIERRELERAIASMDDLQKSEVVDLYEKHKSAFNRRKEEFIGDTDSGSSFKKLMRYNDEVLEKLGIDNAELSGLK